MADPASNPARDIFGERDPRSQLRAQGLAYMLSGAGWAAAVFFGALLLIGLLVLVGQLLPEESKQSPDPTPESTMIAVEAPRTA